VTADKPDHGILPAIREESAEFWEYAQVREFRLQRCVSCEAFRWPPGPLCYACWAFESDWVRTQGTGRLVSWVTFHRQYLAEFAPPYTVGLIELAEGPRYSSLIVGDAPRNGWRYGTSMRLTFRAVEDTTGSRLTLPVFEAAEGLAS
jgi:uncharacterized OB-fold protein